MTTKKERAAALAAMTKAELVRTVVKLDARTTSLLNDGAKKDSEITKLQLQLSALQLDYDKARCLDTVKIANLRAKFAEYADGQTDGDDALNEDALEPAEVEIKDPSEQEGLKFKRYTTRTKLDPPTYRPFCKFPWEKE